MQMRGRRADQDAIVDTDICSMLSCVRVARHAEPQLAEKCNRTVDQKRQRGIK
jgi:hypothetical protein